jgi:DNA-binding transcriptional LysR family regulator
MEFRQLQAFIAVAEQRNFTIAASRLRLTQSAISQQIKALEVSCGVLLFDRSSREVHLTDAGAVLLERARQILAQVENAQVAMAELAGGIKGHCRFASLPSVAAYLLPPVIAKFQQQYPDVELHLSEALQTQVLTAVQQGSVDFGILGLPVHDPHLHSISLMRDEFVLLAPQGHRLVGRQTIPLTELAHERFILFPKGGGGRDKFIEACQQAGFNPQVAFESDDRETILGLVTAGVGVTLLPRLIAEHTRADGPVTIENVQPGLFREVGIVWNPRRYMPQAAQHLMGLMGELAQHSVFSYDAEAS